MKKGNMKIGIIYSDSKNLELASVTRDRKHVVGVGFNKDEFIDKKAMEGAIEQISQSLNFYDLFGFMFMDRPHDFDQEKMDMELIRKDRKLELIEL